MLMGPFGLLRAVWASCCAPGAFWTLLNACVQPQASWDLLGRFYVGALLGHPGMLLERILVLLFCVCFKILMRRDAKFVVLLRIYNVLCVSSVWCDGQVHIIQTVANGLFILVVV